MSTIFLSYARQDAALAQTLTQDLRTLRNTVWLDEEVSGGQAWWDHILDQIRQCDAFVFALSPDALESVACRRESEYAAALGKPVLPILVTGEVPQSRLSPALVTIQYVDYREPSRDASLRLASALIALPPSLPLPEPLPDPPDAPISYLNQLAAEIRGDTPLSYERQSALLLQLVRSLNDPETAEDARLLLTQLRGRRDMLAEIAEEIDKALEITSTAATASPAVVEQRPRRLLSTLLTILLIIAISLAGLWVADYFFSQDNAVQESSSQLRQQVERLQVENRQLKGDLNAANQREQDAKAELTKTQEALKQVRAAHRELQQAYSQLENRLPELPAKPGTAPEPPTSYTNSIGMEFVLIPKGAFEMGSNAGDNDEKPVHKVTITQPFYLGKYEVTQAQWNQVMRSDTNPSAVKGDQLPVTGVSWDDAQAFIRKLNAKEKTNAYRLPTEAEWEYAARVGTTTAYSFGDDPESLEKYGWYDKNSDNQPHAVGQLKANPWGLHDMYGNVWEWVADWYQDRYPFGPQTDPKGPQRGQWRIWRGGSFANSPEDLRSASRTFDLPEGLVVAGGFRCVSVLQP